MKALPVRVLAGFVLVAALGASGCGGPSEAQRQLAGLTTFVAAPSARSRRATTPAALVSIEFGNMIFHTGETLQYSALVYDRATQKNLEAQSVSFELVASGRAFPLPSRRYKPYFWTGTVAIPKGASGSARVRARVLTAGRRFSSFSKPIMIRGTVKAVEIGHSSSQGDYAVAITTGQITRPADGYVLASVETSPSQPVHMNWTVVCVRGTSASSSSGQATDGGPGTESGSLVIKKVRMSLPNADRCTVSFSAQLQNSGHLKIELLGKSRQ